MRLSVTIDGDTCEFSLSQDHERILRNLASAQNLNVTEAIEGVLVDYFIIVRKHEDKIFAGFEVNPENIN